jgi:hypothetical protein
MVIYVECPIHHQTWPGWFARWLRNFKCTRRRRPSTLTVTLSHCVCMYCVCMYCTYIHTALMHAILVMIFFPLTARFFPKSLWHSGTAQHGVFELERRWGKERNGSRLLARGCRSHSPAVHSTKYAMQVCGVRGSNGRCGMCGLWTGQLLARSSLYLYIQCIYYKVQHGKGSSPWHMGRRPDLYDMFICWFS